MIARTWGGKVPLLLASGFYEHLLNTGVKDYRSHSGCLEIKVLRRDSDGWAHFILFSIWESHDAVRAYAKDASEKAVLYADDEHFGLVPDLTVTHYDILIAAPELDQNDHGTPLIRVS